MRPSISLKIGYFYIGVIVILDSDESKVSFRCAVQSGGNPLALINDDKVRTTVKLKLNVSLCFKLTFVYIEFPISLLSHCCAYYLVRFRHKNHLLRTICVLFSFLAFMAFIDVTVQRADSRRDEREEGWHAARGHMSVHVSFISTLLLAFKRKKKKKETLVRSRCLPLEAMVLIQLNHQNQQKISSSKLL